MTGDGFASTLHDRPGAVHWLVPADGPRRRLPVDRWHRAAGLADAAVVARCAGPTLDLGCGPGRMSVALARAGLSAVGVDVSARAVASTRARGAVAVQADLFGTLPAEGRWAHTLLLDGNIGIGGDPVALLQRCRSLLRPSGTVLVELEPPGFGVWQGQAHVATGSHQGPVFRWAWLDTGAVADAAAVAGLAIGEVFRFGCRWFAELTRPDRTVTP
ncbi:Methyltransferase domain-containing protein [Micromonospora echinospora]|uniref:Methyltransferase domain-containing protein n=1 Tax=Micromonospora echinospora TaxID=1877 RepID=A0A1C4YY72_MICEC|nr:class I SAM-dependent methyltransferase [Micromonospora echinospora]SCF25614.1 Methyltransferase domain-containing protein [Micromonospora echinospora]